MIESVLLELPLPRSEYELRKNEKYKRREKVLGKFLFDIYKKNVFFPSSQNERQTI